VVRYAATMRILPSVLSLLGLAACTAASPSAPAPVTPAAAVAVDAVAASAAPTSPITLTYLGVAGWSISDGAHTVLVDPYFSRPDISDGTPLRSDPAAIDAALASKRLPARADVIVIGHSHVDHVLDAPAVALRTGASIIGTSSTTNYGRAAGVPDVQLISAKGGEDYAFEGFSIRVIPGLHSALDHKHFTGWGQLIAPGTMPATMEQFAEGGTLNYLVRIGGHQILVIGSANFIEREVEGLRPDIALVATGLRQEIYDYSCRLMRAIGHPPLVLTNHFDAWTKPAGTPLSANTTADLAAFTRELKACSPATRVVVPAVFEPLQQ
jgi:L-ascorbate metabolism protein UlaG (beta-lactamase superfamily)